MTPAPQIPSHLRFLMAGIQDRAIDLGTLGHTGVRAELDIGDTYAVFELATHPKPGADSQRKRQRITAQLECVLGMSDRTPFDEALAEARTQMAAMLDHLNALIDQATAEEVPA